MKTVVEMILVGKERLYTRRLIKAGNGEGCCISFGRSTACAAAATPKERMLVCPAFN